MDQIQRDRWYKDLFHKPEGWKILARTTYATDLVVDFDKKDHSFISKNMPPGLYKLNIPDLGLKIGKYSCEITVPELPSEELSKKVIDLGEVRLK